MQYLKKTLSIFMCMTILLSVLVGCSEEKKTDKEFIGKMEESIIDRMESNRKEDIDRATLVNTELALLEEFKDRTFYDENLKNISNKYIEGLNIQKEALNKEMIYEYQIEWQKGLVYRCEALNSLYNDYDFLKDNKDFVGTYISQYEDHKKLYEAYLALEEDIGKQTKSDSFQWTIYPDDYEISCTLKNNTNYKFSTTFVMHFYDANGTMYETSETYIEDIKPNSSYVVSFVIESPEDLDELEWYNYYDDVYIK